MDEVTGYEGHALVCSGGMWRMVLSVGRGTVVDNNSLNFFFFYLLLQQFLCILRDTLLHKFSSSYIEHCTWWSHSSIWIHGFRRVFNIMLRTSPFAWTCVTNFQSDDIHVKPGKRRQYSKLLCSGRFWVRTPVSARFSASVHAGPEANPSSCTMGTWALSLG